MNELKHYGILGMKWGIRRPRGSDGRILKNSTGKKTSKVVKRDKDLSKKLSKYSDKELRDKVNRMQMETQYKNLKQSDRNAGAKWANKVVVGAATAIASQWVRDEMVKNGKKLVETWKGL